MTRLSSVLCATAIVVTVATARPVSQTEVLSDPLMLTATNPTRLREADVLVDRMVRLNDLQVTEVLADALVPGHQHEHFAQFYNGVRVFGGNVTRQTASGLTVSVFGQVYPNVTIDTEPTLRADTVPAHMVSQFGLTPLTNADPELLVLKDETGTFRLVHRLTAAAPDGPRVCFVDAHTGAMVWESSAIRTSSDQLPCNTCTVGQGRGVKGDAKKISVRSMGGGFRTVDLLRPSQIITYDMNGDWERLFAFLNGAETLRASDIGHDTDNNWNDGAVVDGHVGAGWTYDYLYARFGRRGLDDRNGPITSVVHPVRRSDLFTVPDEIFRLFYLNAFYCGECGPNGVVVYGEGLPTDHVLTSTGQTVDFFAGALDIVSHELAHGVIDSTSHLIYQNESGALNEAFSDIIGVSAEFFMAESGRHDPEQADYILGEDVFKPNGIRSIADPLSFGDPDHYSIRFLGSSDNGGVHTNSLIASHAFYLAIEGGTNRTSGLSVTGVGSQSRAQIEQAFYRAFTMLMPGDATFAIARTTTVQSARDMFGTGHEVERAITEAWTAVGVE